METDYIQLSQEVNRCGAGTSWQVLMDDQLQVFLQIKHSENTWSYSVLQLWELLLWPVFDFVWHVESENQPLQHLSKETRTICPTTKLLLYIRTHSRKHPTWCPSKYDGGKNMCFQNTNKQTNNLHFQFEFTWTDFLVCSTKFLLSWSSLSPSLNFPGFDSTMSEPVKDPTDTGSGLMTLHVLSKQQQIGNK